jgi:hypothetical protein
MSLSKRYFERQQEEGWSSVGDKFACSKCFEDYAIRRFVRHNATSLACSYCGRQSKKPIAAEMDEVLSFIAEGLAREYEPPEDNVPWESAEGGWQLPVEGAFDLFWDLGLSESKALSEDLVDAFRDRQFAEKNIFSLSYSDALRFTWESFSDQIKHHTRFVFYRTKSNQSSRDETGFAEPHEILEAIGKMARRFSSIKMLPPGVRMIRARQHQASDTYTTAKDLGCPPKESAKQNRMSPAGIPMFYGADSEEAAFHETFNVTAKKKKVVTFATFKTLRRLRMLDLTALPGVPSLFDKRRHRKRMPLIFMNAFARDLSAPIAHDDRVHYEYVPTQVVAEYFRHVFVLRENKRVDGLIFRSSQSRGGICYTLFATAEDCSDPPAPPNALLELSGTKTATINFKKESFQ